jgi:hypothetical protein
MAALLERKIVQQIRKVRRLPIDELLERRYGRLRRIGAADSSPSKGESGPSGLGEGVPPARPNDHGAQK